MNLHDEQNRVRDRLSQVELIKMMGIRPVVAGSAAMVLHGIQLGRQPGDIDAFTTTYDWFSLYNSGLFELFIPEHTDKRRRNDPPYLIDETVEGFPVHIFYGWRYRPENNWDIAAMMADAIDINGVLVASLEVVYQQKLQARRPKDLRDMALILEHEEERVNSLRNLV